MSVHTTPSIKRVRGSAGEAETSGFGAIIRPVAAHRRCAARADSIPGVGLLEEVVAKVFGIHVVELNDGVTPTAFERFVQEQFLPALPLHRTPGVTARLLRADRGERAQKYVFMFEFDSVATRDRYFPEPQRISEELATLIAPLRDVSATWTAMSTRTKTDYIVIAEAPAAAEVGGPPAADALREQRRPR